MLTRARLPLALLACTLLLTGCKKTAAFQIVDASTNQPIAGALVDRYTLYDFTDPRGGSRYHQSTNPADADGWYEIDKPQSVDSYIIRAPGYQAREVRTPEPGDTTEYMVVGGPQVKEWIEADLRDEDGDIPTFVIPMDPN